ncbi:hypothetical protein AB0N24_18495 [Arthrobacter sp. NPDC093128]|uniref:hypothetical protein n=1 Tax=Arthrobacter sp. NPDC093128 TaxID=3154979 RepID=UPI003421F4D6
MASKRRRSSKASAAGAGALGCGPFGFFLALAAIGLLIQYWWVLLIAFGVITLTVALVHNARTPAPPATARPPNPVRIPEPKALVNDDLAAQMRATKHARHVQAMQEWDYEWIRLTYQEKSHREISEIANAFFARGRSVGVNSEGPSARRINDPKSD